MAHAIGKNHPTGTRRKFPTLFGARFAESGVFLHDIVAAVHELVIGRSVCAGQSQSVCKRAHATCERMGAAWLRQADGLSKMRADGFESLRCGPNAVLVRVQISEEPQDAVAVRGPRWKRIEVGQIVSRVETSRASTFFKRTEASEIEFPFSGVRWKKFSEELRCVLRVIL